MGRLLRVLGPKLLHLSRPMAETRLLQHISQAGMSTQSINVESEGHAEISLRSPPDDMPFAVKGLSHIAIAVPDLARAADHYHSAFGAQVSEPVEKSDQGVMVVFVRLPNVCIELLHPLHEKSPVSNFLQRHPKGGIHHICLAVDDVTTAANYLSTEVGVHTIGNRSPVIGAEGKPVLFLNPKENLGVLMELEEHK